MSEPALEKHYTVAEYLAFEETSMDKHEYDDGEILAMSGGSYRHSRIISNLVAQLHRRLSGKPCEVLESNMRVKLAPTRQYVYPDAQIVCNGPQFDPDDRKQTTIENPRVVFEVLSESTERYDHGRKFLAYARVASIEAVVLISQDMPQIELRERTADGQWVLSVLVGMGATMQLRSMDISIPFGEIYERLNFDETALNIND